MSQQVMESQTSRSLGVYLVVAGLVIGLAGTALVNSDAWLLGYFLTAVATTVWLVGCVAVGVRMGHRESRTDG